MELRKYNYEILRNGIRVRGKTNKTYISKEKAAEQASIDFYTKYNKKIAIKEHQINQENNETYPINLTTTL